jgi:hypothetical protein
MRKPAAANDFEQRIQIRQQAVHLIGERAWLLLSCYGKVVGGVYGGRYVSGIPFDVQLNLVERLHQGEIVQVHLMHRHRSGHYELSSLRRNQGGNLVMVFRDREEEV